MKYKLPVDYDKLAQWQRREVREQYIVEQSGECLYCGNPLESGPKEDVLSLPIDLRLFPPFFLKNPIHLQHCHSSGMTEGAVHAYCNAVLWQYHNR